ncbi:MAG: hypothetical protein FWE34_01350 [Defluviitaleaceae bacterium]|nr:hypothetical protein [Defluviitaleaceae bacterium]
MRKGRVKSKMIWIVGGIFIFIVMIVIFFQIPYSPTKSNFQRDVQMNKEQSVDMPTRFFTEQGIEHLPIAMQNHFKVAGLIGQPMPNYAKVFMPSVPLYQSKDASPLILDYNLYIFSHPARLAYMTTSMFGFPFEAYDSTQEGIGFMKGIVGKIFTLFNEDGPEMDRGQLMTWLGEAPLLPSVLLSQYITWQQIDANRVEAILAYRGISGSGIFTFCDNGLIHSFQTNDRPRTATDGSIDFPKWSAVIDSWKRNEDGAYIPSSVKAIWHLSEGDLVYFETSSFTIEFGH